MTRESEYVAHQWLLNNASPQVKRVHLGQACNGGWGLFDGHYLAWGFGEACPDDIEVARVCRVAGYVLIG